MAPDAMFYRQVRQAVCRRYGLNGLGKTAASIVACKRSRFKRVLVIGPLAARAVWAEEWPRFWPSSEIIEMETTSDEIPETGHVVCTFEFARRRQADLFILGPWDVIIVDEFHEIRGTNAKRTRAIMHPAQGLVARTKKFWALTGTPLANHVGELYPLLRLAGIYTGSLESFYRRFCQLHYDEERRELKITGVNERNLPELHNMLDESGIVMRRLIEDEMPELPPLVYEKVTVEKGEVDLEKLFPKWAMSDSMRELVEEVNQQREEAWEILDPDVEEPVESMSFSDGLDILSGLAESMPELLKLVGMQKVAAVIRLVRRELKRGLYPKIFMITRHTMVGEALAHGLRRFNPVRLYGQSTAKQRKEMIKRFTEDPECQVFIGQVRACGPSVNLTAKGLCYEVMMVEQSPTPGENNQAVTRPRRIGQKRQVRVRIVQLNDPVDQRWEKLVHNKNVHIAKAMRESLLLSKEFKPKKGA
jgi:SWI/SNF-related matrix-associated actin-dependent regulator of chromatin subfamily A-like protein 1